MHRRVFSASAAATAALAAAATSYLYLGPSSVAAAASAAASGSGGQGQLTTSSSPSSAQACSTHMGDLGPGAELVLVQVVFRHGARTPLTSFTDFWKHDPQWDMCAGSLPFQMSRKMPGGCFAGELTLLGHMQAWDLGQQLRRRYVEQLGFLQPQFSASSVSCRTTNFDRTIKSLTGVLSGLYPDHKGDPVPVVTSADVDEILYADTKMCPHLAKFIDLSKRSGRSRVLRDPDYGWARAELMNVLGLEDEYFTRPWAMTDIHDAMTSMRAHGKKMPEGMTDRLLEVVNRLATREFAAIVSPSIDDDLGRAVLRLSLGVLCHTLVENMEKAVSSSSSSSSSQGPSLYLYSGHDSTIMPLLAALGLELTSWPVYLTNLSFELWRTQDGQYVVRVLYNMTDLQIPYCPPGHLPSLHKFKEDVVGPFVLSASEWGEACKAKVEHDQALPNPISASSPGATDED